MLEIGVLILANGGFLRQLILQSLHPLLHVVSLLKEFPARLIAIGGPPTGLSVICTREGASQHGLGDVVDFIVPCYPGATISDEVNIIIIIMMLYNKLATTVNEKNNFLRLLGGAGGWELAFAA